MFGGRASCGHENLGTDTSVHTAQTARLGRVCQSLLLLACWILPQAHAQFTQQGGKIAGSGAIGAASQGKSVALSADGNTAIIGAPFDNGFVGAAWVFVRSGGGWSEQAKLTGADTSGISLFGSSVALSSDGNTALIGGNADNNLSGAAWVFTRSGSQWSQQGPKLVGTGASGQAEQGWSVALSGDGNTAAVGGPSDDNVPGGSGLGAVWVFVRSGSTWTQQAKLTDTGGGTFTNQGDAVSISSDGATILIGGTGENDTAVSMAAGAAWVFVKSGVTWTQQAMLIGSGAIGLAGQGISVGLSSNGNTAIVGGNFDSNGIGAAWIFTRTGATWALQAKLVGGSASGQSNQGLSVSISGDGNTAVVGGPNDNSPIGATWVFTRSGATWSQLGGKLIGSGSTTANQGTAVAISADARTILTGGRNDQDSSGIAAGAAWVFASPITTTAPSTVSANPLSGTGSSGVFNFTFSDTGGYQALTVVNVLINSVLDGRAACYIGFVPSGPASGSVFLVDNAGDAGGPFSGFTLPGAGVAGNNQCAITGAGSSVSTNGTNLVLTLAITFTPSFAGNRVFYLSAQDASGNSGWQPQGVWNIPGAPVTGPAAISVNPPRSTTLAQTYTFTFTDPAGASDISVVDVLINSAIDGRHACYLAVVPSGPASGSVFLVDDAGDAGGPFAGGILLPGAGTASNSQCSVVAAGSSISAVGTTLTVNLAITFNPGFAGNQVVFVAARNNSGGNSGWQPGATAVVP
jgi:hypothetical protein